MHKQNMGKDIILVFPFIYNVLFPSPLNVALNSNRQRVGSRQGNKEPQVQCAAALLSEECTVAARGSYGVVQCYPAN